jgi:hypothetical protein
MRQPTTTLPITPKMLRHFAVVTFAITACLGIFANGENSKVSAKSMNEMAHNSGAFSNGFGSSKRDPLAGSGNRESRNVNGIKLATGTKLISGGEDDGGVSSSQSGDSFGTIQNDPLPVRPPSAGSPAGASAGYLGNGFAAQPGSHPIPKDELGVPAPGAATSSSNLLRRSQPQPPRKATQQEIEKMMAASRQRSGAAAIE